MSNEIITLMYEYTPDNSTTPIKTVTIRLDCTTFNDVYEGFRVFSLAMRFSPDTIKEYFEDE